MAGFLKQQGFGQGDVAGIVSQNCWQFAATFVAVGLCGGALSGASYLFTPFELQQQFNDCKASVVFCSVDTLKATREAKKTAPSIQVTIKICVRVFIRRFRHWLSFPTYMKLLVCNQMNFFLIGFWSNQHL